MSWFLVLIITLFSAILLYPKRFTSSTKVWGFYFVQFYYLLVVTPITSLALINIGLEIIKNPEIANLPLETNHLISIYFLFIIIVIIATTAHSVATSISEALRRHTFLEAYSMIERIHGSISHEMLFAGITGIVLFMGLLGVNHPSKIPINPVFPLFVGIIVGLICCITVLRSTHVLISLINGFFTSVILIVIINVLSLPLNNYPYVTFALICANVIFVILLISTLAYFKFRGITKIMIKVVFPKGHRLRDAYL